MVTTKIKNYSTRIIFILSFIVIAVSFVSFSHAAQTRGDNEIQLTGNFFHAQGVDAGTIAADISYGKFLTKAWEVGFRQALTYSFIDEADDVWIATTIPFVNYHLTGVSPNDKFQPFLGIFAGASWNNDDTTGTAGPSVGFKQYLSRQTFLVARYRYEWFFTDFDVGGVEENSSDGNHVGTIGLGFVWGGRRD